jgi:hypothetical protein
LVERRELCPGDLTAQDEELLTEQYIVSQHKRLAPSEVCYRVYHQRASRWLSHVDEAMIQ